MVKVSIVIPVYNVQRYLRECLDSVVSQTLKDIEIICVDDGSNDNSGKILDEYAGKDERIKVIHKKNTGYGHSMNVGFDATTGEYIGIVESDDYADKRMFETLYNIACNNDLDVVKSGFYYYYTDPVRNEKVEIVSKIMDKKTICPSTDFKSKMEMVEFYNIKPTIWSAIYKRSFIKENNIRFLETPGASYQDAGFSFKVMATAKRVQLIREAFLHYRQDNSESSVNSKGKVFCVCDEYKEMQRFLDTSPILKGRLESVLWRIKFDSYMWNFERVGTKYKFLFLERASEEFKEGMELGVLDKNYFERHKWERLERIIKDPVDEYNKSMLGEAYVKEVKRWKNKYEVIRHSYTYRIGFAITFLPRAIRRLFKCIRKHGLIYTFTVSLREFTGGRSFE